MAETRIVPQGWFVAFRATRLPHYGRKGVYRVTMYSSARPANAPEHQKVAGLRTAEDVFFAGDFTRSDRGAKKILLYLNAQLPLANWCTKKTLYQAMKVSPSAFLWCCSSVCWFCLYVLVSTGVSTGVCVCVSTGVGAVCVR